MNIPEGWPDFGSWLRAKNEASKCWCERCRPVTLADMRMVVCPECGDKRRIHARNHEWPCASVSLYDHNRWVQNALAAAPPAPAAQASDGMPSSKDERYLRRLLAYRVNMPQAYYDDGEAQGAQHGISIDFMRDPVADIDAKLCALNVARAECADEPPQAQHGLQAPLSDEQIADGRRPSAKQIDALDNVWTKATARG